MRRLCKTPPDNIFVDDHDDNDDHDDFFDGLGDVYIDDGVDVDDDNTIDYDFEINGMYVLKCKIPHDGIIMTMAASSFYQQKTMYHTCSL